MKRSIVDTGSANETAIGFSRAVRSGNVVAVSGTGPMEPNGDVHAPGDVYAQTKRCLELALGAMAKLEGRPVDVIRTRVMLTDITTWNDAARAHGEVFGEIKPACTFVGVSAFVNPLWMVEIEIDGVVVPVYDHSLDR